MASIFSPENSSILSSSRVIISMRSSPTLFFSRRRAFKKIINSFSW